MGYNRNSNIKILSNKELLKQLHIVARKFSAYVNKNLLFFSSAGRDKNLVIYEIQIKAENFMHLTGCRTKTVQSRNLTARDFFYECLNKTIRKEDFDIAQNRHICTAKLHALSQALQYNFAKLYEIGNKDVTTEKNIFDFGIGNTNAIIAYSYKNGKKYAIPTSAMSRNLRDYIMYPMKVVCILIKEIDEEHYREIHSAIMKDPVSLFRENEFLPEEVLRIVDIEVILNDK